MDSKVWLEEINKRGVEVTIAGNGIAYYVSDSSECASHTIIPQVNSGTSTIVEKGYCDTDVRKTAENRKNWIVDDYYSPRRMKDSLETTLGYGPVEFYNYTGFSWKASYGLGKQSSFETDSVVLHVKFTEKQPYSIKVATRVLQFF